MPFVYQRGNARDGFFTSIYLICDNVMIHFSISIVSVRPSNAETADLYCFETYKCISTINENICMFCDYNKYMCSKKRKECDQKTPHSQITD